MPNVGLDIGSYAIKVIVANKKRKGLEILHAFEVPNPVGSLLPTDPQQVQLLGTTLTNAFKEFKIPTHGIRVSLPESLVATKIVTMPLLSDAELSSAIQWQVEQHIPIPLEDMQYEYTVLRRSVKEDAQQDMDVLMIGTQKRAVQMLADNLLDAGLDVVDMETDTLSQLRVIESRLKTPENLAILHIGASASTVSLLNKGVLTFVRSFPVAGSLFSRAIERGVGLDAQRAEEYKRTYGLLAQPLEGRVRTALLPIVNSLADEVQKTLRFFAGQHPGETITRVFISGGVLYMPDFLPYLSQMLSVEMVPIELIGTENITFKETVPQDSRFVVAAGLAMKEI
jgi:type IV pilus assembly protein PilM